MKPIDHDISYQIAIDLRRIGNNELIKASYLQVLDFYSHSLLVLSKLSQLEST